MPKTRLITIDLLRILAAIAIVGVHTSAQSYYKMEVIGYHNWIVASTLGWFGVWGTPVFIMISGYLLLNSEKSGWEFFTNRLKRMALPWLFWNVLYFWWNGFISSEKNNLWHQLMRNGTYYHLYFLNVLIGLYTITPWLKKYFLGKNMQWVTVVWMVLAYIYQIGIIFFGWPSVDNVLIWFLPYVGYYLAGYWIGRTKQWERPRIWLLIATGLILSGALITRRTIFLFPQVLQGTILFHRLSWMIALVAVIIFRTVLKLSYTNQSLIGWAKILAPLTMGIYFIHPLWIDVLKKWPWFAGLMTTNFWLWFGGMWLVALVMSALCTWCLKRIPVIRGVV